MSYPPIPPLTQDFVDEVLQFATIATAKKMGIDEDNFYPISELKNSVLKKGDKLSLLYKNCLENYQKWFDATVLSEEEFSQRYGSNPAIYELIAARDEHRELLISALASKN